MDSRPDTEAHIEQVDTLLRGVATDLIVRGARHDQSKLQDPEKPIFDQVTGQLAELTYGSDEYKAALTEMGPALEHHYAVNDHHPEHHDGGVGVMNLVQVVEMLCDWIAATRRHDDGDIHRSIDINAARFGYGEELRALLHNSVAPVEALQIQLGS